MENVYAKDSPARERHETQPCYTIRQMQAFIASEKKKLREHLADQFLNELGCVLHQVNAPGDAVAEIMDEMEKRLDDEGLPETDNAADRQAVVPSAGKLPSTGSAGGEASNRGAIEGGVFGGLYNTAKQRGEWPF